jgi:hypothetical protein
MVSSTGVWVFFNYFSDCITACAFYCGYAAHAYPAFRAAVCRPPDLESCDDTTVIEDSVCPSGQVQCIGTGAGSDAAGQYTITCSE